MWSGLMTSHAMICAPRGTRRAARVSALCGAQSRAQGFKTHVLILVRLQHGPPQARRNLLPLGARLRAARRAGQQQAAGRSGGALPVCAAHGTATRHGARACLLFCWFGSSFFSTLFSSAKEMSALTAYSASSVSTPDDCRRSGISRGLSRLPSRTRREHAPGGAAQGAHHRFCALRVLTWRARACPPLLPALRALRNVYRSAAKAEDTVSCSSLRRAQNMRASLLLRLPRP